MKKKRKGNSKEHISLEEEKKKITKEHQRHSIKYMRKKETEFTSYSKCQCIFHFELSGWSFNKIKQSGKPYIPNSIRKITNMLKSSFTFVFIPNQPTK